MSAFNLNEPIYSVSFIIRSKSASGNDASAAFIAEADHRNSASSDYVPQQQGMNEGTKHTLYDHLFVDLDSPEDDLVIVVNDSDEDEDDEVHATKNVETEDTLVPKSPSSRIKKVNKFDFVIEDGKHIHLTEEQINQQKKIDEEAKAEAAKRKSKVRKEELIDLLGLEVVNKYYNDKLQYDRYCDKVLNRRAVSKITNCDVLTKKGPITLKVYKEDSTSEIIPNFRSSDLHLGEWREVMKASPNRTGRGWKPSIKR
nr:hypothetical protein [Tanacetum cinerariifolium]